MKIKRTLAKNMREGLKKVRDEHGPDAVILSNKKVADGIEIISALDFDEEEILKAAGKEEKPSPFAALSRPRPIVDEMPQQSRKKAKPAPAPQDDRFAAMFDDEGSDDVVSLSSSKAGYRPDLKDEAAENFQLREEPRLNIASDQKASASKESKKEQMKGMNNLLSNIEWPHDSALNELKQEVTSLRGLFEDQLSVLEWVGVSKRNPNRASLLKRLHSLGIAPGIAKKLAEAVNEEQSMEKAWQKALSYLTQAINVTDDDILNNAGVVAIVGPTGVGKTTTVAKLAARYTLRHGRGQVALVTTDCYRIGAHDQLRSFGKILGVPVYVASDQDELKEVVESLADKQLVLIDTAGMSQRDIKLAEQIQTLDIDSDIKVYLTMSANTQQRALSETVKSFSKLDLEGCILTKVDESANLGGILTTLINNNLPLAYVGVGQRVPEDLQPARADELVQMAVELSSPEEIDDEGIAVAFAGIQRKHGSLGISY